MALCVIFYFFLPFHKLNKKGATGGNDLVYDNPGNMTKPNVPGMIPVSNGFDFKDDEETVYDNKTGKV